MPSGARTSARRGMVIILGQPVDELVYRMHQTTSFVIVAPPKLDDVANHHIVMRYG